MHPTPIIRYCKACARFEKSTLAHYGYCRAAPTLDLRARLLPDSAVCILTSDYL